ncbi:MAG TPA: lysoplasmalogenase [Kofleriaceae bacterium]
MIAATIACAVACAVLVWAEWRGAKRVRVVAKPCASLAFVAVGVLAGGGRPWMIVGLALGLVGDLALLGAGKRAFLAGLGAFWLGHAAYVAGIAGVVPPSDWLQPLALVPAAAGVAALVYLWPHLDTMRVPVIAYVAVIVAMTAGALAAWQPRLTPGAVLFFVSDLAVARDAFVARGFSNRAWGLPAYYAGQLLIAWSLA